MTREIPREKWNEFFNDLSRRRFGWTTRIEVLDESMGDHILTNGLPLGGVTFEERSGRHEIEISLGESVDRHHMHTVLNPVKVEYLSQGDFAGGVLEIAEANNNRMIVSLLNPMPLYVGFDDYEIMMISTR